MTVQTESTTVSTGARLSGTATAAPVDGAEGAVEWAAGNVPRGVKVNFTPGEGTAAFTIDVGADVEPGAYPILIGVRNDTLISSQRFLLTVARPLFGIPGLNLDPHRHRRRRHDSGPAGSAGAAPESVANC